MTNRQVSELARIHFDDDIGPLLRELLRLRRLADAARALRDSMPNNLFADAVVTKEFWKALAALDKEAT